MTSSVIEDIKKWVLSHYESLSVYDTFLCVFMYVSTVCIYVF